MSATAADYRRVRADTDDLAAPLSAEDCCVQSMTEASPTKWHLAHTTWFFETFVLERFERDFRPFDSSFRVLFNSYYHTIGQQHPRPQRGMLTRPALSRVREFRRAVDERMERLLAQPEAEAAATPLVTLGLHHEQQHQELMLTDIKHLFSLNPTHPAYLATHPAGPGAALPLSWHAYAGGTCRIGHDADGFGFDNEHPRHVVWLEPFELGSRLTTNAEFLEFVADGGYATPQHWLSDGWDWLQAGRRRHPCYWQHRPEGWFEFTLAGLQPLDPARPVVHVSYYEADAYARWAGARLPSEAEWEVAAAAHPVTGHFADRRHFHPAAAGDSGLTQIFGDAWEWTCTAYAAYPGFHAAPGAVGEYNGKFMVNQYVLRGGSCATPPGHMRASYRNFFPAAAAWQFAGIRLAR